MSENIQNMKHHITFPGDKIAVVEEFIPGIGTYDAEGVIFSEYIGHVLKDKINKIITVKPISDKPIIPREGSIVTGTVVSYQERMASIDIFMIDSKKIYPPYGSILHISNSSGKYERVMNDVCKTGDIVKAKVIDIKNRVPLLSTHEPEFGVIKAFCSRCGEPLKLKINILHCSNCDNNETRKIAITYDQF